MTQAFINNLADKLQKVGTLHAIGETWISIDSTIPAGGVPFLGQLVSRSVWADLFAWATAQGKVKTESEWQSYASANGGNCPFYSDGDGSTTFRMPKVVGYIKGAASQSEAGTYTPEGLPNITGKFGWKKGAEAPYADGAIALDKHTMTDYSGHTSSPNSSIDEFDLDASRSSPIYGNSDHVTPETHSILIGVYAVGAVANIGSADATQFLNGLATLEANTNAQLATLEANTNAHIRVVETWSSDTEWYRVWSDGWIEQGGYLSSTGKTVTFKKAFTTTQYTMAGVRNSIDGSEASLVFHSKTTTSFYATSVWVGSGFSNTTCNWYACGY